MSRSLVRLTAVACAFATLFFSRVNAIATQEVDIVYANDDEYDRDPTKLYLPDVAIAAEAKAVGLVVYLHGRCMDGDSVQNLIDLKSKVDVDSKEFILALPEGHRQNFWCSTCSRSEGILNTRYGCRTWAATEACCARSGPLEATLVRDQWEPYNDVTHLYQLIMAVKSQYNIDPSRVFIVGFENGGFMAHRMACEHPEILAGIVSISGASFQNAADCKALNNNSVHHPNILQIAGRLDRVPTLNGGSFEGVTIPSMKTTAERWALHHGCVGDDSSVVPTSVVVDNALNFRTKLLANAPDTSTETWTCNATSACVENWVINGMNTDTAVPNSFTNGFSEAIIDWMGNHTRQVTSSSQTNEEEEEVPVVEDDNSVATQSGPGSTDFGEVAIIDTSTALDGRSFEACPSDFLQCPDGSFTSRQIPTCSFFCDGEIVATDGVFCSSSDCCGVSQTICAETSACKDVTCEEEETVADDESSSSTSLKFGISAVSALIAAFFL